MQRNLKISIVAAMLLSGAASAQTADWIDGIGQIAPAGWSMTPANPSPGNVINFQGPTDKSYGNSCNAEGGFGGTPYLAVNQAGKTIELKFQGPAPILCPLIYKPVVGLKGSFGPLASGNWTFKCTHSKIPFHINFTVGGGGGGNIIHVDENAPLTIVPPNGSSWVLAYHNLQDGLAAAHAGDTVRVADGMYTPDVGGGIIPGNRHASFTIPHNVTVQCAYAGFNAPNPNARDIDAYPTYLSGDLNGDDLWGILNISENSYHVVSSSGPGTLDGAIVVAGNADGFGNNGYGGGLFLQSSTLMVTQCKIRENNADFGAGVACVEGIAPVFLHTEITGNWAYLFGGALYNDDANVELTNCLMVGNTAGSADILGSDAIFNVMGSLDISSCTIADNRPGHGAPANFRAISNFVWGPGFVDTISVKNSIVRNGGQEIWSTEPGIVTLHYNNIEGGSAGFAGSGNIDQDPLFKNPGVFGIEGTWYFDDDGYTLLPGSPSIDAGNQAFLPLGLVTDLNGNPRVQGANVDQGAYEGSFLPPAVVLVPNVVGLTQFQAQSTLASSTLTVGIVTQAYHASIAAGRVISQNPHAGATANVGASVDLVISLGPAPNPGPSWVLVATIDINMQIDNPPPASPVSVNNPNASSQVYSNFAAEYKIEVAGIPAVGGNWSATPSTGNIPAGISTLNYAVNGSNVDVSSMTPGNRKIAEVKIFIRPQ